MEGLAELIIRNAKDHGCFLCVSVYSPETQQLNTSAWLSRLYGFEDSFNGGRFRNYTYSEREFQATISRSYASLLGQENKKSASWFGTLLDWIGEEIETPWHIKVSASFADLEAAPDLHFHFSFSNADDAVLFKMKFA